MKKILSIILLAISSLVVMAASNATTARNTLDKAAAKINMKSGATANFTIQSKTIGTQKGTIAIKGTKFCANTGKAIIWYDGKTQWLYNKQTEEVNVSTPSAKGHTMNPYTFLTLYKDNYTLSQTNTASGYQVHLTGKGKSISEMYILTDKSYNIKQIKMKQSGAWYTITVSNLKNKPLADSAFRFQSKDFPQAEVIDLR